MHNLVEKVFTKILTLLQIYLIKYLDGQSSLDYLDIGASGLKRPLISFAFNEFKIIAFDPDPRTENLEKFPFKVDFYPFAVYKNNGIQNLYLTKKSHCSSLKKPIEKDDPRYNVEKIIEVECRTLNYFAPNVDIMKIDAQGAELDILKGSKDIISNIKVIELEAWFTNKYEDQPKIDEIHDFMNRHGFIFIGFSALYYENSKNKIKSGLSFGDMIFIKNKIKNRKVILSYLVITCLDKFIKNLDLHKETVFKDKILLYFIILFGKLKISAPKYF